MSRSISEASKRTRKRPARRVATRPAPGPACIHCGNTDENGHVQAYPNGNQQYRCAACGRLFIVRGA